MLAVTTRRRSISSARWRIRRFASRRVLVPAARRTAFSSSLISGHSKQRRSNSSRSRLQPMERRGSSQARLFRGAPTARLKPPPCGAAWPRRSSSLRRRVEGRPADHRPVAVAAASPTYANDRRSAQGVPARAAAASSSARRMLAAAAAAAAPRPAGGRGAAVRGPPHARAPRWRAAVVVQGGQRRRRELARRLTVRQVPRRCVTLAGTNAWLSRRPHHQGLGRHGGIGATARAAAPPRGGTVQGRWRCCRSIVSVSLRAVNRVPRRLTLALLPRGRRRVLRRGDARRCARCDQIHPDETKSGRPRRRTLAVPAPSTGFVVTHPLLRQAVRALAMTPDGQHIIIGSEDHTVPVWSVASRKSLLSTCRRRHIDGLFFGGGDARRPAHPQRRRNEGVLKPIFAWLRRTLTPSRRLHPSRGRWSLIIWRSASDSTALSGASP